ncbi:MAG: S41 family peptidase [Terracidiphilus sp.]
MRVMANRLAFGLILLGLVCVRAHAQVSPSKYTRLNIADILGFEVNGSGELPVGWRGSPAGAVAAESNLVHSGKWAVCLDLTTNPSLTFGVVTGTIPVDFTGSQVELHGYLRTENVPGFAGLWLREDGDDRVLALDNMQKQQLNGTHDWHEFQVHLPLNQEATTLYFGALISGGGKVWVDDLTLLVDGKPVAEAAERKAGPKEIDTEFDNGSGIELKILTPLQVEDLATLARVWGFLKYHHPAVTAGKRRWDYELFRIMPGVVSAESREYSNTLLAKWIDSLGPIDECSQCTELDTAALKLGPDLDWIRDTQLLGTGLSKRLQSVYRNRVKNQQYYVALAPGVGNPVFKHESAYGTLKFPDAGFQLLGLFRLWNMVEYWAPNRDIVGEDWAGVLRESIPEVATAANHDEYGRAMLKVIAQIHDTHANMWSSLNLRPPYGQCGLPITVRFVSGKPVVADVKPGSNTDSAALERGDEIVVVDGEPVSKLVADWTPYYADSNDAARMRDMGRSFTSGECGPVKLDVRRRGAAMTMNLTRIQASQLTAPSLTHDLPGPAFRLLSKDVAYLKLSNVKAADVPQYIESAKGTRGLIVDIRNYPSEFVVFALGSLLVKQSTPFVIFSVGDLSNPGAFHTITPVTITPADPHYDGKVVILVDETTQSSAEYTTMALGASPHATVVGSMTAGADGNVSAIPLPGGFSTMISGLGVFYPDGSPTQRVGVHIDVEARPTIDGIRAGKDEVLEKAIQLIDPVVSAADLERMAKL